MESANPVQLVFYLSIRYDRFSDYYKSHFEFTTLINFRIVLLFKLLNIRKRSYVKAQMDLLNIEKCVDQ